jgi:predicted Zn finger-like uncharacterized protein
MPEIIRCPSCERQVRVPDQLLGKLVKCPTCGTTFTAPANAGNQPAQPPRDEGGMSEVGPHAAAGIPPEGAPREGPSQPRQRAVLRSDDEEGHEEYEEEDYGEPPSRRRGSRQQALNSLRAPAICLLITGILGLVLALLFVVDLIATDPANVKPPANADRQTAEAFKRLVPLVIGPIGLSVSAAVGLLNLLVILGAIMMLVGKMRWLAVVASFFSLVNVGCCCLFSLPFGIWSLVILFRPESQSAFQ